MTPRIFIKNLLIVWILFSSYAAANAVDSESLKVAQELCSPPPAEGSRQEIKTQVDGKVTIRLIGRLGGDVSFTKEEWDGVQRVLRKDQLSENQGYRDCVKVIFPLMMDKLTEAKDEGPTQADIIAALESKFKGINRNLRDRRQKCNSPDSIKNNPIDTFSCLQFLIMGGGTNELSFQIGQIKKLGCSKAVLEAGYICDYTYKLSAKGFPAGGFDNGFSVQAVVDSLIGSKNSGQGRFLRHEDSWHLMSDS